MYAFRVDVQHGAGGDELPGSIEPNEGRDADAAVGDGLAM